MAEPPLVSMSPPDPPTDAIEPLAQRLEHVRLESAPDFDSSSGPKSIWKGNLNRNIFPHVVKQLDPKDFEDLLALLVIQRVCKSGWNLATPMIYRDITVNNWEKLFVLPSGSTFAHLDWRVMALDPGTGSNGQDSFDRRFTAFKFVKRAVIRDFPSADTLHGLFLMRKARKEWREGNDTGAVFPNLDCLVITTLGAEKGLQQAKRAKENCLEAGLVLLPALFSPKRLCIRLPDDYNSTVNRNGLPPDFMSVNFLYILHCLPLHGAEFSIHNVKNLTGFDPCTTDVHHRYRIYYSLAPDPPSHLNIPPDSWATLIHTTAQGARPRSLLRGENVILQHYRWASTTPLALIQPATPEEIARFDKPQAYKETTFDLFGVHSVFQGVGGHQSADEGLNQAIKDTGNRLISNNEAHEFVVHDDSVPLDEKYGVTSNTNVSEHESVRASLKRMIFHKEGVEDPCPGCGRGGY